MKPSLPRAFAVSCLAAAFAVQTSVVGALAQSASRDFTPEVGQAGKDVIWVPTAQALVDKMLDMAKVTAADYVIDLGSGDGRNVIAAARRGARGHGIEFDPALVDLSRRRAETAGVSDRVAFIHGDMFEFDIAEATLLPLFLMDDNLQALLPRLMTLNPGTRIVVNGFEIPGWAADDIATLGSGCGAWCVAYLYIVPAPVEGIWRLQDGSELALVQRFQHLSGYMTRDGTLRPITAARLTGDRIRFAAGDMRYRGRVQGSRMGGVTTDDRMGEAGRQRWEATRASAADP